MEERKTRPLPDKVAHWKQLNDSPYLGAWDIPEGKSIKVTIESVHQEEVYNSKNNKKEWKNVLAFKGAVKKMILNKRDNPSAIASHYGNQPAEWIGKEIELERKTTRNMGEVVECIRVKAKGNSQKAAEGLK